jgi:hypothetical protein
MSESRFKRWGAPAALLLLLAAAGCRPETPDSEMLESGGWDFYLGEKKVGSETYILRRSGRQLQCQVRSEFPEALVSAEARLRLSARYRPIEFILEAKRSGSGEMQIEARLDTTVAQVRLKRGDLVREDSVEVSPRVRLLEEGLVTLGQLALKTIDLRRHERFAVPVLLPQRFMQAEVQVENLGLEKISVGGGPERPLRHVRLSLAGGASDYWLDEDRRVVRYLSQVPAGELEARRH